MSSKSSKKKLSIVKEIAEEARDKLESDDMKELNFLRTRFSARERPRLLAQSRLISQQEKQIQILKDALDFKEVLGDVVDCKPVRRRFRKTSKTPKAYILHLSDTHSLEIVTREQTDGFNEHNEEIGSERLGTVINRAIEEIQADSIKSNPIHTTVSLGGDFTVNADLHYKMERSIADEPLPEMKKVYKLLKSNLDYFWRHSVTDSNSAVCSFSNHGRDSEKMLPGIEAERSYDVFMYEMLKDFFEDVNFTIGRTNWTVEDIHGFKTMHTHGHASKCSVKKSSEGVMVPSWTNLKDLVNEHSLNAWIQGHYHTRNFLMCNQFAHIQNSSLVGYNGYACTIGVNKELPSQNLIVIDLERQVVEKVIPLFA